MARTVPGEMADSIKEHELILAVSLLKFLSSRVDKIIYASLKVLSSLRMK